MDRKTAVVSMMYRNTAVVSMMYRKTAVVSMMWVESYFTMSRTLNGPICVLAGKSENIRRKIGNTIK